MKIESHNTSASTYTIILSSLIISISHRSHVPSARHCACACTTRSLASLALLSAVSCDTSILSVAHTSLRLLGGEVMMWVHPESRAHRRTAACKDTQKIN